MTKLNINSITYLDERNSFANFLLISKIDREELKQIISLTQTKEFAKQRKLKSFLLQSKQVSFTETTIVSYFVCKQENSLNNCKGP